MVRDEEMERHIGQEMVEHVRGLLELVKLWREYKAECGHGLDGTPVAGHALARLRAMGATLQGNVHAFRWPFDVDAKNDPKGIRTVRDFVGEVLTAIEARRPGDIQLLADAAELWPKCATKPEADRLLQAMRAPRTAAEVRRMESSPPSIPQAPRMPTIPAPPPGRWHDGEYLLEEFEAPPAVG